MATAPMRSGSPPMTETFHILIFVSPGSLFAIMRKPVSRVTLMRNKRGEHSVDARVAAYYRPVRRPKTSLYFGVY